MPDKLARRQESQAVIIWYCKVNYILYHPPEKREVSEGPKGCISAVYEAPQSHGGVVESQINPGQQWKFEV